MCVDFTDFNKACPKYNFSLSMIDILMDLMAGHQTLSFMEAFLGYNQINMLLSLTSAILLQSHALWVEEYRNNLPKASQQDV